jgi:hypothetical protein
MRKSRRNGWLHCDATYLRREGYVCSNLLRAFRLGRTGAAVAIGLAPMVGLIPMVGLAPMVVSCADPVPTDLAEAPPLRLLFL